MPVFPKFIFSVSCAVILALTFASSFYSQTLAAEAENIRREYKIPELAYAVVSSDAILEMKNLGVKRVDTSFAAESTDRFHLGSNTKAITGFVAALLIKQRKLDWNTKFFALFPELKKKSRTIYDDLTLQQLLTFRAPLPAYTYTNRLPKKEWITGDNAEQRMRLAKWFLKQKPQKPTDKLFLTNAGYMEAIIEKLDRESAK